MYGGDEMGCVIETLRHARNTGVVKARKMIREEVAVRLQKAS